MMTQVENIKNWEAIILDSTLLLGILITSFVVLYNQKNYNPTILVQLALLVVCYIGYEINDFYKILNHDTNSDDSDLPEWIWISFSVSQVLFLAQHWVFTAQYLKVALIFELAFCVKTEQV